MVTQVSFRSENYQLAGLWQSNVSDTAAVICHPHPLYGGDMHNPVVVAAAEAYAAVGISTLRFNFRGVGGSGGHYSHGKGEQTDLIAAIDWLGTQGITQIHLCGYSFGAWISALVVSTPTNVIDLVMIAPPVTLIQFPAAINLSNLSLVIAGADDNIAPVEIIQSLLRDWNPNATFVAIPGADHFLTDSLDQLRSLIESHLTPS